MRLYKADLHIHSALSPCGDLEMGPGNIISQGISRGLDIISLTDHNMSENCIALKIAAESRIFFIPGIEVSTMEDIHVLVYFASLTDSLRFQDILSRHFPPVKNVPEKFGYQVVVDSNENIIRMEDRLLISPVNLELENVIETARGFDTMIVLSHIDSDSFSITSQLGFIPEGLNIDGVEIQKRESESMADSLKYPAITSSDAHYPGDIGRRYTEFYIKEPTLKELKLALKSYGGRSFRRVWRYSEQKENL